MCTTNTGRKIARFNISMIARSPERSSAAGPSSILLLLRRNINDLVFLFGGFMHTGVAIRGLGLLRLSFSLSLPFVVGPNF
jgi:hypothetical protein